MRLVLIDEKLNIIKEYENNCTQADVDGMFDKMEKLILASKAQPKPRSSPPPLENFVTTTLSGSHLSNWFQGQMEYYEASKREREEVKRRADKYLQTKAGILKNNFFTAIMNWINRKLKRKPKEEATKAEGSKELVAKA